MTSDQVPSKQLVLQRIRNRIIEYFEVTGSFEEQHEYQLSAPVSVPKEMINQWEDWVSDPNSSDFSLPVFTSQERTAIGTFHAVWDDVAASTPNPLPPIDETHRLPAWERLRTAARAALRVFEDRGRLPEDEEI